MNIDELLLKAAETAPRDQGFSGYREAIRAVIGPAFEAIQAENERMKASLIRQNAVMCSLTHDIENDLRRIDELERESAALRQDAERYRWLREYAARGHSPHMDGTFCFEIRRLLNGRHKSFDDAIDAVRNKCGTVDSRE